MLGTPEFIVNFQMIGVVVYLTVASLTLGPTIVNDVLLGSGLNRSRVISFVALLSGMTTVVSGASARSLAYVVLTWGTGIALSTMSQSKPHLARQFLFAIASVAAVFISMAFLLHGFPGENRFVGGIQPNYFAQMTLAGVFAFCLASNRGNWLAVLAGLVVILLVSSRSSLLGLLVFSGTALFIPFFFFRLHKAQRTLFIVVALITLLLIVVIGLQQESIVDIITNVLALDDPYRGLGTGGSGRVLHLIRAAINIASQPFAGFGFRSSTSVDELYTDTAYVNIILDLGIPVGTLFIGLLCYAPIRRLHVLLQQSEKEQVSFHSKVLAVQISALCMMLFQPYYLNIGNMWSIMFILSIFAREGELVKQIASPVYYRFVPLTD